MRKKLIVAALTATLMGGGAALAAAATATAQTQDMPPPGPGGPLLRADADKDGVVTRDEVLADVAARFARLDADKDGKISKEERQAMKGMRGGRGMRGPGGEGREGRGMGRRGDANGDGVISLDEQKAQALKMFAFVDRNSDGKVDQAEREQMHEVMMAMRGPGPRGHRGPPPPPAGPPNQ